MPYQLLVTGGGGGSKFVLAATPAATSNSGRPLQVEWEIELEARRTATDWPVATKSGSAADELLFLRTGADIELRSTGNANWIVATGVTLTNFNVFRIRTTFDGTTRLQQLFVNGSLIASRNPTNANFAGFGALFALANDATRSGEFRYLKWTDFVTPANNRLWDARVGNGTQTVLNETVTGATASLTNLNYSWVFYSSGGTAYADLLNGATFSSSIGTLVSSTAHTDVLSGASYTSSVNSLNATRGYGDTLSGLTYSASVGQLDARRGYSSLLVGGSYAYTVGNLESTNTSATGRDDALQGVSLSISVGSLVSTVQRNTTLAGLSYTSAVGNLSASLAYNSALLGLTYSASVNTLLHTWSGEVTVTIEGYTIRYADSAIAAAYANDIISAGYAADILERITWQH